MPQGASSARAPLAVGRAQKPVFLLQELDQSKQRKMTKRSLFIEKGRFTGSLLECARITDMNFGGTALMGLMMAPPRPRPQMSSVPRAPDADKTGG